MHTGVCKDRVLVLQFHIDQEENVSRTPGPVKLLLPDLGALQQRLQDLAPKLKGTKFKAEFSADALHSTVVDPWGQQFSISQTLSKTDSRKGAFEGLLLPCHAGTARAIAQFYQSMLQVHSLHLSNLIMSFLICFCRQSQSGV